MVKTTASHPCLVPSTDLFIQQHHRPIHLPSNHMQCLPTNVRVTDSSCDTLPTFHSNTMINSANNCTFSSCSNSSSNISMNNNNPNCSNNNNNNINNNNNNNSNNNICHFYPCVPSNASSFVSSNFNNSSNSNALSHLPSNVYHAREYSHCQSNVSSMNCGNSSALDTPATMSHAPAFAGDFNTFGSQSQSQSLQNAPFASDNRFKYPPCLPYGLYYDFDNESDQDISNFELDKLKPHPSEINVDYDDYDEWKLDDAMCANPTAVYDSYLTKRLKSVDTGPTLAELNCSTDATDTDDLFSDTANSNIFKSSHTNFSTVSNNLINTYESDLKSCNKLCGHNNKADDPIECNMNEEMKSHKVQSSISPACDVDVKENVTKFTSSRSEIDFPKSHRKPHVTSELTHVKSRNVSRNKSYEAVHSTAVKSESKISVEPSKIAATEAKATSSAAGSTVAMKMMTRKSSSVTFCEASTSNNGEATAGEVTTSTVPSDNSLKGHNAAQSTLTSPDLARVRNSSMSTEGSISSHDEGFASQQEESDDDDADSSDDDSFYGDYDAQDLLGATTSDDFNNKWSLNIGRARKNSQQRYFWQYNVQAKGPKGNKVTTLSSDTTNDPHILMEASDPVFSPECSVKGVKHAGKARRGDGNDLTPNPRKLLMIGLELKKLSHTINELTPVAEVPVNARGKSRKEKNKLASRACRLKKKAQHEANKIKLFGLQQEHKKTLAILGDIKSCIKRLSVHDNSTLGIAKELIGKKNSIPKVAGQTAEFVNMILDNVASGQTDGGLTTV